MLKPLKKTMNFFIRTFKALFCCFLPEKSPDDTGVPRIAKNRKSRPNPRRITRQRLSSESDGYLLENAEKLLNKKKSQANANNSRPFSRFFGSGGRVAVTVDVTQQPTKSAPVVYIN